MIVVIEVGLKFEYYQFYCDLVFSGTLAIQYLNDKQSLRYGVGINLIAELS